MECDRTGAPIRPQTRTCPYADDVAATRETPAPGTAVGDYLIERLVGAGSSADVYLARPRIPRPAEPHEVALKVLHAGEAGQHQARARFEREFEIASLLRHRNIVRMYSHGEMTGDGRITPWLAMQYAGGPASDILIPGRTPNRTCRR